jgi:hypothetical protein
MMKKKLILHLGLPKTGTSKIQKTFHINHSLLSMNGILYPGRFMSNDYSHNKLAFMVVDNLYAEKNIEKAKKLLLELYKETTSHTLVLSSECFPLDPNHEIYNFLSELYQVHIVINLRNPSEYLESCYRQIVKDPVRKETKLFSEYFDENVNNLHLNYISVWRSKKWVSKVTVLNFDAIKSDLLNRFFSAISLSDFNLTFDNTLVNPSTSFYQTECCRTFNFYDSLDMKSRIDIINDIMSCEINTKECYVNKVNALREKYHLEKNEFIFNDNSIYAGKFNFISENNRFDLNQRYSNEYEREFNNE